MAFKGKGDAWKLFCLHESVANRYFLEEVKSEKVFAYLAGIKLVFYFEPFTIKSRTTCETKDNHEVEKMMLEKFSVQGTVSEIMKEAASSEYNDNDLQNKGNEYLIILDLKAAYNKVPRDMDVLYQHIEPNTDTANTSRIILLADDVQLNSKYRLELQRNLYVA